MHVQQLLTLVDMRRFIVYDYFGCMHFCIWCSCPHLGKEDDQYPVKNWNSITQLEFQYATGSPVLVYKKLEWGFKIPVPVDKKLDRESENPVPGDKNRNLAQEIGSQFLNLIPFILFPITLCPIITLPSFTIICNKLGKPSKRKLPQKRGGSPYL